MRLVVFLIALFITSEVRAQTKTIKYRDKEHGTIEEYTVLKSDPTTREGKTKIYVPGYSDMPIATGFYHNGIRDSLWMHYSGKTLVAEGRYVKGQKTGVWLGFAKEGLRLRYNYTTNELLFYKPTSADTMMLFKVPAATDTTLVRLPIYLNGIHSLLYSFMHNIRYPAAARVANKQGGITLTFTIDENGTPGNFGVKNSLGYAIDEEVINVGKMFIGDWIPATIKGKAVAVDCEIPILFLINPPEDISTKGYLIVITAGSTTGVRYY